MNKTMSSSTMGSPPSAMKMKKRASWDLISEMASDMVNRLDLGDESIKDETYANGPSSSLPAMSYNKSISMQVPTKGAARRGSQRIMNLFSSEDELEFDYDPSAIDLKSRAKQQISARQQRSAARRFPMPVRKNQPSKKDPLLEFHERAAKAENEYKKKEMAKKQQQLRDHDEEKSVSSSNSFFDFLVGSAADDIIEHKAKERDGYGNECAAAPDASNVGGMKRNVSTHSMASLNASAHSMASFMGLFGDDAEQIAKLSSNMPLPVKEKEEDPSLHAAVKQSKSVKGHRVFAKGKQAGEKGNWKKAVAYYHIALVKQREHYGEDHLITSNTLNSLGLALTNLGEHFGALTALEEALHIRQEALGAGAEEVAETTSNIWMVLKASQDEGS